MTYLLPIPVPAAFVDERGVVCKNDFGHAHSWLTFAPGGRGYLTSDLFYNYYRYDKTDNRDLRALVVTQLSPQFSIERVVPLEALTHALTHTADSFVFNNDLAPPCVAGPDGELAFTAQQNRTTVLAGDLATTLATFDPLTGGPAGASDLVALPDGGFVVLRDRDRLAIIAPGSRLADGVVAGRELATLIEGDDALVRRPEVAFDEYRVYAGPIAALAADRICVALFVPARSTYDADKFRYVIVDELGRVVATLPLGEADSPYQPAAAPHHAAVAHRGLDAWITRSDSAVHAFDRDGARIARIGLDADDALAPLGPLALLGAAPGGELVLVHRKHHVLVVTDPIRQRIDLAPALAAAAAAYKAEYARLKKAVRFEGGRFVGWEAQTAPAVASTAPAKKAKKAAAPVAPLPEPPPARDPEQALGFSPDAETCAVYADWLGMRGDPLGEYIAAHYALAKDPDGPDRTARVRRANALYAEHGPAWQARWNAPRPITTPNIEHLCGLPSEVVIDAGVRDPAAFETQLGRLPIRAITVRDLVAKAIAALGDVPALRRIARLAISGDSKVKLGKTTITWLTNMRLAQLEELYLYRAEMSAAELIALVDSLPRLRALRLSRSGVTADVLARIADSPAGARLEKLALHWNPLGSAGMPVLARFPALRDLDLSSADLGDDVATGGAIGELPITRLVLGDNARLTGPGLRAIVAACPALRELVVPDTLTAEAVRELVPLAPRLQAIDTRWMPAVVVDTLAREVLDHVPALFSLTVRNATGLGATLGSYPHVTSLSVGGLGAGDVASLASVGVPGAYTDLDLDGDFDDAALIALARSPRAARVRHVTLASPAISERGLAAVLALPALESVLVSRATLGDAAPLCARPADIRLRFHRCEWKKKARAAIEAHHRALATIV